MKRQRPFVPNYKFSKEIFDGVLTNVVTTNSGERSLIGEDDLIIEVINMYSQKYRRSLQASDGGELYFNSRHGTVYLRQIAEAFKEGISVEELKERKTRVEHISGCNFLEDGTEDCRPEMLITTDRPCYIKHDRKFEIIPGATAPCVALTIYQGNNATVEYMDYIPELIDALATPKRFGFFNNGYRVQVVLGSKKHAPKVYLSVIAAAYKYGMLDMNNLESSILAAKQQLKDDGEAIGDRRMTVEHFNSDSHNHCSYNISIVPFHDNASKGARAGAFAEPYRFYGAVAGDDSYLVEFHYPLVSTGEIATKLLRFPTIEDFNWWSELIWKVNGFANDTAIAHYNADGVPEIVPTPYQLNNNVRPLPRGFSDDCFHAALLFDIYSNKPELFEEIKAHRITLPEFCAMLPGYTGISGPGHITIWPVSSGN